MRRFMRLYFLYWFTPVIFLSSLMLWGDQSLAGVIMFVWLMLAIVTEETNRLLT
jgi:hypothetical protein